MSAAQDQAPKQLRDFSHAQLIAWIQDLQERAEHGRRAADLATDGLPGILEVMQLGGASAGDIARFEGRIVELRETSAQMIFQVIELLIAGPEGRVQ